MISFVKVFKSVFTHIFCAAIFIQITTVYAAPVNQNDVWNNLNTLGLRIKTSKIHWERTITIQPHPTDASLESSRVAAYVKRHGGSIAQAKGESELAAQAAMRLSAGTTQKAQLSFLNSGPITRCEVEDFASELMNGVKNNDPTAYDVDIIDDKKSVSLSGYKKNGKMIGNAQKASEGGLQHSAIRPGDLQFLIGSPLTAVFTQQDTQASIDSKGNIILNKAFGKENYYRIATITVSNLYGFPIQMDETYKGEHTVRMRYIASQFQQYNEGIYFPSLVTITHYDINGGETSKEEYNLVSAVFNLTVSNDELYQVNEGSSVRDTRFASPVSYSVKGQKFPSDQSVLSLVQKNQISAEAEHASTRKNTTLTITIAFFMIVLGMYLWIRSSKRNEHHIKSKTI